MNGSGGSGEPVSLGGLAELVIEAVLDGVVVISGEGRILVFNAAAGRIFGVEPRSMIGGTLERLFVPGMFVEHQRYIRDYLAGSGRGVVGSIIETEGWHSAGHPVPVEISLSEARLGDERALLACIRDITRRREDSQRQRALRELAVRGQRIDALGTLSAGMSHDFGNTLGAIMGYASTVLGELPRQDPHYADVAQILALAHRARRLTEALLRFNAPGESSSEPVALNGAVRGVLRMLRHNIPRSIRVRLRLATSPVVQGDAAQIEQCLMNLCLNARDAMPDGGELTVETRGLTLDGNEAAADGLPPGRYCLVSVRDNGVGMDQATLERLGQPSFSTKPSGQGRGLGLSVVKTIARAHGGAVRFRSELGKGTEVRLLLPTSDRSPSEPPPRRPAPPRLGGETVLVVDDDRPFREMIRRLLQSLGYRVLLAGGGLEALRLYREQQPTIDLVLLDLRLEDMDGLEVLRQLRGHDPEARVLVSSGLGRSGAPPGLRELGACGYLAKPFGADEFGEAVRQAMSGAPPGDD